MSGTTRNLRDAVIIIRDGTATPNTLQIPIDVGDLAFTWKDPTFIVMNRGKIDSRKQGDETPSDVSWSVKFEQFSFSSGNNGISVVDALKGIGGAASWVSVDPCAPFSVDVEFRLYDPCNKANYEQLIFRKFHADEVAFKEGNEFDTLSVKGQALVAAPERAYITP